MHVIYLFNLFIYLIAILYQLWHIVTTDIKLQFFSKFDFDISLRTFTVKKCLNDKEIEIFHFGLQGIIACDPDRFQFASGIKIIPEDITGANEELWIVTNRFQKVMVGTFNFTEVNFRIMKANVTQLTNNTVCALPWLVKIIVRDNDNYYL